MNRLLSAQTVRKMSPAERVSGGNAERTLDSRPPGTKIGIRIWQSIEGRWHLPMMASRAVPLGGDVPSQPGLRRRVVCFSKRIGRFLGACLSGPRAPDRIGHDGKWDGLEGLEPRLLLNGDISIPREAEAMATVHGGEGSAVDGTATALGLRLSGFPTPLVPVQPAGSLIYEGSVFEFVGLRFLVYGF